MGTDRLVRRRSDAIAAVAGFAVLVACGLIARSGTVGAAERSVFEAINGLPEGLEPVMHQAQFLGVLAIGPLVALVALAFRRYRLAVAAALVTLFKLVGESIVWKVVHRERPGVTEPNAIVRGGTATEGVSFVSGHVVLVTGLAWVITPYLRGRSRIIPWLVVALVGFARMYLGAHNPLDVLGGLALGVAIGAVANLLVKVPVSGAGAEEPGREAPAPSSGRSDGGP
ncbi:MAG TPA: phosphatase PAP2 family protein [Actinomycetota bacterium]|jgi:undecaprenyl-diphosphatase|nr:phosphatase PAP2 family protein [Actinomycetota bacterium]